MAHRAAGRQPVLPPDAHPKRPEDIVTLAGYAARLDADVIAIQEVDGREIAARIFPPDRYSIHMTSDHVVQRVGLVVRRGLHYDVNPDVTALVRRAAWVGPSAQRRRYHAASAGRPLRILAVHLKTGCERDRLTHEPPPGLQGAGCATAPLQALDRGTRGRRACRSSCWATSTAGWTATTR